MQCYTSVHIHKWPPRGILFGQDFKPVNYRYMKKSFKYQLSQSIIKVFVCTDEETLPFSASFLQANAFVAQS